MSAIVNELDIEGSDPIIEAFHQHGVAEEGRERWYAVDQRALAGLIENPTDLTIERE